MLKKTNLVRDTNLSYQSQHTLLAAPADGLILSQTAKQAAV